MGKNSKANKIYISGCWYLNTYRALGDSWLLDSLQKLELRDDFCLANLSANAAWYENDVYEKIKETKNPWFYVGDLLAENLRDEKAKSHERFKYLEGQKSASDIDTSQLDNKKMDVIVDCKGALWYATWLGRTKKSELIKILESYRNLLREDGVLLIDFYDNHNFLKSLQFEIAGGLRKETSVQYFGEPSTKNHLKSVLGNRFVKEHCQKISIATNDNYPLSKFMGTAYMSVEDINVAIEMAKTKKIISLKYKYRRLLRLSLLSLSKVGWLIIALIALGLIATFIFSIVL